MTTIWHVLLVFANEVAKTVSLVTQTPRERKEIESKRERERERKKERESQSETEREREGPREECTARREKVGINWRGRLTYRPAMERLHCERLLQMLREHFSSLHDRDHRYAINPNGEG